jgi:hypothetical protein
MIPLGITMTTEIKTVSTADVFSPNELIKLTREAFVSDLSLAAAEWTMDRVAVNEPFMNVLTFVFERLGERFPDYSVWLLTGDEAWRVDSRAARHKKRFRALKMRGIDFEVVSDRTECMIEKDGMLKFFGAVRLEKSSLPLLQAVMTVRSCSYLVAWPAEKRDFPISSGWSGIWQEDSHLIELVAHSNGIVFQRTGFFDDPEVGLLAVGNPIMLGRLARDDA